MESTHRNPRSIGGTLVAALCGSLLWIGAAQGATNEAKCQAGRANAAGKYQYCVQKWITGCYVGGASGCGDTQLSKCRSRYATAWAKLQLLQGSSCAVPRFADNGPTVTDNLTGLVWEKKTDDSTEHDVDNVYSWTDGDADPTDGDGTVFTVFLESLNSDGGFAGSNDWRLPTFAELQTIALPEADPCSVIPCIDAAFGPHTQAGNHWSATTLSGKPSAAWDMHFGSGFVNLGKSSSIFARAVRGGI